MQFIFVSAIGIVAGIVAQQWSRPHLGAGVMVGLGILGAFAGAFIAQWAGMRNGQLIVLIAAGIGAAAFLAAHHGLMKRQGPA